jgi:hypothetical protein
MKDDVAVVTTRIKTESFGSRSDLRFAVWRLLPPTSGRRTRGRKDGGRVHALR